MLEKIRNAFREFPEIFGFIGFVLGGIFLIYFTNNFIGIFAPFIIAYVITLITRPLMLGMVKKLKIPKAIASIFCLLLVIGIGGLIIWFFIAQVVNGITYIIDLLGNNFTAANIVSIVENLDVQLQKWGETFNVELDIVTVSNEIYSMAKSLIASLSNLSIEIVVGIPSFVISFVIGCLAGFYMLFDYDKIFGFFEKQFSKKTARIVKIFNTNVLFSIFKMMMSYVVLSVVCFVEIVVGFYIMGVKDAWFLAFLIAVFDVLPILGSGGILVPWSIIGFLTGNPVIGFGMLILWGVIVVVRQILEPRVVGSQIGLHPLITVMALFIGLKTMGGLGLLMGPLYVIVCKKMNEEGIISLYKA